MSNKEDTVGLSPTAKLTLPQAHKAVAQAQNEVVLSIRRTAAIKTAVTKAIKSMQEAVARIEKTSKNNDNLSAAITHLNEAMRALERI